MPHNTVLIAENHAPVSTTLVRMLGKEGYRTVVVRTRAELEHWLDSHAANTTVMACILDYSLPDAPEGEALPVVMACKIPTIILTAKTDQDIRKRILNHPIVDYITKSSPSAFEYAVRMVNRIKHNPSITVLVVDDSNATRIFYGMLLRRQRYRVLEARDAAEALALLQQHPEIMLVLTDNEMPGMSGVEMCSEIRRFRSSDDLAIIGISSANDEMMTARFLKADADDYLVKSSNVEEFFCRITRNIEYIEKSRALNKAANEDPLTGLINRRRFFQLAMAVSQRSAVAIIDVDFFKRVNDNHGHDAGDAVLKQVATVLAEHFCDDIVARFGGEEFVVLLPLENARQKLEQFRQKIAANELAFGDESLRITVSIGGTPLHGHIEAALKQADKLLYLAKENGRNRLEFS